MMCQRTTSAVTYIYESLSYHCTNYIDHLGSAETPEHFSAAFQALGALLARLGLEISPDKDSPPSTCMVFLGILVNTEDMTVSVTPDRVQELLSLCSSLLTVDQVSRHDLQSLLGVMSFVTACVRPARVFMSTLLNTLKTYRFCQLTSDNKADLHWWYHFLPVFKEGSLIKTSPWSRDPLYLFTDACSTGAGGYFSGQYFHTPFTGFILQRFGHDINTLELLSIMLALKLWGASLRGQRLVLQCDNENSVLAINSGRSCSLGMQLCLHEIWFLSSTGDFELVATHILGITNTFADHLSRWHLSPIHHERFLDLTEGVDTFHVFCPPQLFDFQVVF